MATDMLTGNRRLPFIRGSRPSAENSTTIAKICRQLRVAYLLKSSNLAYFRTHTTRMNGYEKSSASLDGNVARNKVRISITYGFRPRARYSNAIAYDKPVSKLPYTIR